MEKKKTTAKKATKEKVVNNYDTRTSDESVRTIRTFR